MYFPCVRSCSKLFMCVTHLNLWFSKKFPIWQKRRRKEMRWGNLPKTPEAEAGAETEPRQAATELKDSAASSWPPGTCTPGGPPREGWGGGSDSLPQPGTYTAVLLHQVQPEDKVQTFLETEATLYMKVCFLKQVLYPWWIGSWIDWDYFVFICKPHAQNKPQLLFSLLPLLFGLCWAEVEFWYYK